MHVKDNLTNFLYDKNYFISVYENSIYFFNYCDLVTLAKEKIIVRFMGFQITITGEDLYIAKLLPKEMLIKGKLKNIGWIYE